MTLKTVAEPAAWRADQIGGKAGEEFAVRGDGLGSAKHAAELDARGLGPLMTVAISSVKNATVDFARPRP